MDKGLSSHYINLLESFVESPEVPPPLTRETPQPFFTTPEEVMARITLLAAFGKAAFDRDLKWYAILHDGDAVL
ncbi:hypothetical protein SAMD00019534_049220 [Acytostelium subglobosum LB1]|uniref:hypothetical protein n=1 Tax=Acytostelium subglobosum LB1 TaxID=1410327 RepID=UPI0006451FCD|nr:hypothetical protein SAMD00019534_049220 [Acytostelium subglobosum LB1]GAM21747.1 hypothetical protein SAMD00019534_049220 [Acytostelium subglobosum LB1]|eukprot:XP_012754847.1 hypothetical protein SAMD00019534_049220 [Acytostelium subglobosum LB1]